MKRIALWVLLAIVALYAGDWVALIARGNAGQRIVTLDTYYVVKLKSGKTEYDYAGPQDVACVRAMLPHGGNKPCWYVGRKKDQQITIDSGDPNNPKLF